MKSLYSVGESGSIVQFPRKIIQSPYVPPRVGFFVWVASWRKVLTLDQLKRRGWTLANRCFFCLAEEESTNHILTIARRLEFCGSYYSLSLWGDLGSPLLNKGDSPWLVWVLYAFFWVVWKERNRIAFDNEEFSVHRLKYSFVCSLWSWTKLYMDADPLSLINFFYWLGSR